MGDPLPASWELPCVQRLRTHAFSLSALYFNRPVWLVGGALTDPDPRDLDVVIILPDALFVACYGSDIAASGCAADMDRVDRERGLWCGSGHSANPEPVWRRWARDCAKVSEQLTRSVWRRVDFKTQIESIAIAQHPLKPQFRLDATDVLSG